MKAKKTFALFIIYALLVATGLMAVKVASSMMYDYKFVVDGIMSLTVIYLSYMHNFSSTKEKVEYKTINDILFEFPENIKGFFSTFFWTLILYWAVTEVTNMVKFLITD